MRAPRSVRKKRNKLRKAQQAERDALLLENAAKRLPKDKAALLAAQKAKGGHGDER